MTAIDSLRTIIVKDSKKCENKQYGWLVTHKFRCKTKGGNSTIGTYVYFMDDNCKQIYRSIDEDDITYKDYKAFIDGALSSDENSEDKESNTQ